MDQSDTPAPLGWLASDHPCHPLDSASAAALLGRLDEPLWVVARGGDGHALAPVTSPVGGPAPQALPLHGWLPPLPPARLGAAAFRRAHGVELSCYAGAMAKGIASERLVEAMGRGGMLGFFGSAGLSVERVDKAIGALRSGLGELPFGMNLINSLNDPALEASLVDLFLRRDVRRIEAAAYMELSLPLVRFRVTGIHRDGEGRVVAPNQIVAKVSREEVAARFMAPPPPALLAELVAAGKLTEAECALAREIPMAGDVTAEADSGGHTDNRPALAMLPTFLALRDRLQQEYGFAEPVRVGLAGGIATPAAAAAAFAMGAAYVVTGSVNQACVEAGTCDGVRELLAQTRQADLAMAPAADMFEMGVTVQVLKRGTMFAMRAAQLYDLYRTRDSIEAIPAAERARLEKTLFQAPLEQVWQETREFFLERDPAQVERAEQDPKHKLALLCRSYLGRAPEWANRGVAGRRMDWQIWCGPAMGAFNEWVRGSFLEDPQRRRVVTVARNIMVGAARLLRCRQLATMGVDLPAGAERCEPVEFEAPEGAQRV